MSESLPETSVTINIPRGLCALVDRLVERYAAPRIGTEAGKGIGDIFKAAIRENPSIPQEELSAVEIARRLGILQPVEELKRRAPRRVRA